MFKEAPVDDRQGDLLRGICDTVDAALASVSYDGIAAVPDFSGVRLDYLRALVSFPSPVVFLCFFLFFFSFSEQIAVLFSPGVSPIEGDGV